MEYIDNGVAAYGLFVSTNARSIFHIGGFLLRHNPLSFGGFFLILSLLREFLSVLEE